jgi:polyisoprenyl-phosphate glycosyltransferase
MTVILLIGGLQTILLSLIGEYLSRLYLQTKNRPLYVIRDLILPENHEAYLAPVTSGQEISEVLHHTVRSS